MLLEAIRNGSDISTIIMCALSCFVVIFLTLPIHEWAHGFVSTRLGDPTPRYQGRLTLNPLAHIDVIGAIGILLFGIGWAKPVQVNARYYKNPKVGMAIVAAAGPISNMIVALIASFLSCLFLYIAAITGSLHWAAGGINVYILIADFFEFIAIINVNLAVFNLIPIPPFDGSRILFTFLPQKYYFKLMQYERYIFIGLLLLLYTGVLDAPLQFATSAVYGLINNIAFLPFKFLLAL
ncbi:MAG: site-2 protease family protein [Clostridia bacterium]|nr:site-2 protease family protein [Clostridia bacterium]